MFDINQDHISKKAVDNRKRRYLKNWKLKGKTQVQNMGKTTVNKLHAIACEILNKPYTSHTWHRSAVTNLVDAGMSFINLKWHGQ